MTFLQAFTGAEASLFHQMPFGFWCMNSISESFQNSDLTPEFGHLNNVLTPWYCFYCERDFYHLAPRNAWKLANHATKCCSPQLSIPTVLHLQDIHQIFSLLSSQLLQVQLAPQERGRAQWTAGKQLLSPELWALKEKYMTVGPSWEGKGAETFICVSSGLLSLAPEAWPLNHPSNKVAISVFIH